MSLDKFTQVTNTSWGGRIGNSIGGIIFGILLIGIAFALLFWNEGRSVKTAKSLKEGAKSVISISSNTVDSSNEGKLVHLTGFINTDEILSDPEFGISVNAIKLSREVKMYQWEESSTTESQKKLGGGTTSSTTYTYNKVWSRNLIQSTDFAKPEGHQNPDSIPYESREYMANEVKVDDTFTLTSSLLRQINNYESYHVDSANLPKKMSTHFQSHDGVYYSGDSINNPEIGDVKISFKMIKPRQPVSLVAKQVRDTFSPYRTKVGRDIELLSVGHFSAEDMFEQEKAANKFLTWILRGVGYILMVLGFSLVFAPLSVLFDVIPFLGNLVGLGTGLVAFILATFFSFFTVAIAWFTFRPLLSTFLIVLAVTPFVLVPRLQKSK